MCLARMSELAGGISRSASPVMTSVGDRDLVQAVGGLVAHDRRDLAEDRLHAEAVLQRAGEDLDELRQLAVDELLVEDRRQQVLEEAHRVDGARGRSSSRRSP